MQDDCPTSTSPFSRMLAVALVASQAASIEMNSTESWTKSLWSEKAWHSHSAGRNQKYKGVRDHLRDKGFLKHTLGSKIYWKAKQSNKTHLNTTSNLCCDMTFNTVVLLQRFTAAMVYTHVVPSWLWNYGYVDGNKEPSCLKASIASSDTELNCLCGPWRIFSEWGGFC